MQIETLPAFAHCQVPKLHLHFQVFVITASLLLGTDFCLVCLGNYNKISQTE